MIAILIVNEGGGCALRLYHNSWTVSDKPYTLLNFMSNLSSACQCKIRLHTQVYMVVYEDLGYFRR